MIFLYSNDNIATKEGNTSGISTDKGASTSGFSFGSTSNDASKNSTSTTSSTDKAGGLFGSGTVTNKDQGSTSGGGFSFGSSNADTKKADGSASNTGFRYVELKFLKTCIKLTYHGSFGGNGAQTTANAKPSTGFSFGKPAESTEQKSETSAGLSFGGSDKTKETQSTTGSAFSFGGADKAKDNTATTAEPAKTASAAGNGTSTGFSFGSSQQSGNSNTSSTGFSFGGSSDKPKDSGSGNSTGFNFGSPSDKSKSAGDATASSTALTFGSDGNKPKDQAQPSGTGSSLFGGSNATQNTAAQGTGGALTVPANNEKAVTKSASVDETSASLELNGMTIEQIITMWHEKLQTHVDQFAQASEQVRRRDVALLENQKRITKLAKVSFGCLQIHMR